MLNYEAGEAVGKKEGGEKSECKGGPSQGFSTMRLFNSKISKISSQTILHMGLYSMETVVVEVC